MKKHNRMKKHILLIFIITTLVSCKEFLDEVPVGTLSYGYYDNETGIESLIRACYSSLRYNNHN